MKRRIFAVGVSAGLLSTVVSVSAQDKRSDVLARQWRDARRQELEAEKASIDEQLKALATATPAAQASSPVVASTSPAAVAPDNAPITSAAAPSKDEAKTQPDGGEREFAGLKLGVGLSYTADVGKLDRISDAQVVDGVVRAIDQNNGRARIMLESHYFFTPGGDPLGIPGLAWNATAESGNKRWGWGPFVAIQPGSGEIIDAIGAGIMFGFRRGDTSQSFNIGVGAVIDPNVRVLGDGFRENAPPPGNETEVRFRETAQLGVLILTSFSF